MRDRQRERKLGHKIHQHDAHAEQRRSGAADESDSSEDEGGVGRTENHDDWARSLEAKKIVSNAPGTRSFCDAILTPAPGDLTFALGSRLLSGGLRASDADVRSAMQSAFRCLKIVAEPGGAAALAAALHHLPEDVKGKRVGVMVTGGNVDPQMFAEILTA